MKQLLQIIRNGKIEVVDVPVPSARAGTALVRCAASLISAGTERSVVEFGGKNLLAKARSRPDLVRQVLDKARREGPLTTLEAVLNRLDQPMALGYSSAGTIAQLGDGMDGFKVGDRVACAGGGFAVHAEYGVVPRNLLVPLPAQVDFESAAFTTLGAIALQGFRLAQPQVGDRIAVIGLGLLGLLSVGIARAAGCRVFGVDLDARRIALGQAMGAYAVPRHGAEEAGQSFTQGRGFDAVLICADTRSNDPVALAGVFARDRAMVIAVGAVGLNLPRKNYFEKELQFIISRSYGPGRYDSEYEEHGRDYPYGYVRWTEGRNMQAVVELLASGALDVRPLITHRFPIEQAEEAYRVITGKSGQPFLGVLLTYPQTESEQRERKIALKTAAQPAAGQPGLGVLGAGNYATAVFLPGVAKTGGVTPVGIATGGGLSARHAAQRFGYEFASSDEADILNDERIRMVAILTRHNQHARQVAACFAAGKHVFCEKPLALNVGELETIKTTLENHPDCLLMVGFNRRFAPLTCQMTEFFGKRSEPMAVNYRVNAGYIPLNHWVHDVHQGGGRIIGEGCHFIDYLTFIIGEPPVTVRAYGIPDGDRYREDNVVMTFTFSDGSLGTVSYLANGDKSFPKERVEVFCGSRVAVLDDFRSLELVNNGQRKRMTSPLRQDKGHQAAWQAFLRAVKNGGEPPIPYAHLLGVTQASFAALDSLRQREEIAI
ncbi:MAG: bi-domain-containing oxidoreductase [Bellilinea sp.]|jgi:predicted dehydrogenase/threonine dehydrogenase-like Zn-dependent dehydrogenase